MHPPFTSGGGLLTALTPAGRKYREAMKEIDKLLEDCVRQRLLELTRQDGGGERARQETDPNAAGHDSGGSSSGSSSSSSSSSRDLLGVLIEGCRSGELTEQEVKDQLLTFLLAGEPM